MEETIKKSKFKIFINRLINFWLCIFKSKTKTAILLSIILFIIVAVLLIYPSFYNTFLNCSTDDIIQYHAYAVGFLNRLKASEVSLYDRTLFGGTSFFASVYYIPLDIFLFIGYLFSLLMPTEMAYVLSNLLRVAIGSLILYYFFVRKNCNTKVALLLGLIFFVGGITQAEMVFPVYLGISFYVPLGMLIVDLLIDKKGFYYLLVPIYVFCVILYDYYIGYMILAFFAVFYVIRYSMELKRFFLISKEFYIRFFEFIGLVLLGVMMAAVILIPSISYVLNESSRNDSKPDPSLWYYTTGSGENLKISVRHYFTMWCNYFIPNSPFSLCLISAGDYMREHATFYMTSGGIIYLAYFFFTRGKGEWKLKIWLILFNLMFCMPIFAMIFTVSMIPYSRWFFIPYMLNFYAMGLAMDKKDFKVGDNNFIKIAPLIVLIAGFITLSLVVITNPEIFIHYSQGDAYFYPILIGTLIFIGIYILLLLLGFIFQLIKKYKLLKLSYTLIMLVIFGEVVFSGVITFSNVGSRDYMQNEQAVTKRMNTLKSLTNYSYNYRTNMLSDKANALTNTNVILGMTNYGNFFQSFYNTPLNDYTNVFHNKYNTSWSRGSIYGYNLLTSPIFANKYVVADNDCANYVHLPEKYYTHLGTIDNTIYYEQKEVYEFMVYDKIFTNAAMNSETFTKDLALLNYGYVKALNKPADDAKDDEIKAYNNYDKIIKSKIDTTNYNDFYTSIFNNPNVTSYTLTRFDDGKFDGNGYFAYDLTDSKYQELFKHDMVYFSVSSTEITSQSNHHFYLVSKYKDENGEEQKSYHPIHYNLAFKDTYTPTMLLIPTNSKTTSAYVKAWGFDYDLYDEYLVKQREYKNREYSFKGETMNIKFTNDKNKPLIVKTAFTYSDDWKLTNDNYQTCNIDAGFLGIIVPEDVRDVNITLNYEPKYFYDSSKLTLIGFIVYNTILITSYCIYIKKKKVIVNG